MTSSSKADLRSPDDQRSSAAAVTRWLWAGLAAATAATLVVQWLLIDDLRQRVARLEDGCRWAGPDGHLPVLAPVDADRLRLANSRRSAATVGRTIRVFKVQEILQSQTDRQWRVYGGGGECRGKRVAAPARGRRVKNGGEQ